MLVSLLQTDALLLIRPYISRLTLSEIHAVMTSGLAGISGTVLGVYISFGVRRMWGTRVGHLCQLAAPYITGKNTTLFPAGNCSAAIKIYLFIIVIYDGYYYCTFAYLLVDKYNVYVREADKTD